MNAKKNRTKRWALVLVPAAGLGMAAKAVVFPAAGAPRHLTAKAALADVEEAVLASGTLEAVKQAGFGAQASGQVKSFKALDAQEKRRTAEVSLAENRLDRLENAATLHQALGGDARGSGTSGEKM